MLKIRAAIHNDATPMMLLHREAIFLKASASYDTNTLNAWAPGATPDRIARVEEEIADPKFIVLIAEAAGQIIGFAMAIPSTNELRAVYVKPNSVGNVGRRLLAELEDRAVKAGARFLACDASLNAESFYKANGYVAEGRADHTLSSGSTVACVQMRKNLPTA